MSPKRLPRTRLPVTDRAVLRWLELHGFVDVEAVREQIWRETREALNSGASKVTVNGTQYRMKGGRVVTLVDRRKAGAPVVRRDLWHKGAGTSAQI